MPPPVAHRLRPLSGFRLLSASAAEDRSQKIHLIADELLDLNRLERHDYSILFRLKLGLQRWGPAAPEIGPSASPVQVGAAEAAAEKTVFDIKLEKFEASAKLKVIKEVRAFTELGLKEAKDLVEKVPVVVKKGVAKEDAEKIAAKLREMGAIVLLE